MVWAGADFRKQEAIDTYNRHMGGVDVFDQLAYGYRLPRQSKKNTILEIAVSNAFILMAEWRALAENEGKLPRVQSYAQAEFRENLVRQLLQSEQVWILPPPPPSQREEDPPDKALMLKHGMFM